MNPDAAFELARGASYAAIYAFTAGGFLSIYLGTGALTVFLTRSVFPGKGIGVALSGKRPTAQQVRGELLRSLGSIAIFGFYGVLAVWLDRHGMAPLTWSPHLGALFAEVVLLVFWNELHFYACHRLLHTRPLYRTVHLWHHRSVPPTPWSTFSFHPLEAALLGSVMVFVQLVHPLNVLTLLAFPLVSLMLNNLGHMDYDLAPGRPLWHPLSASRRHALHHQRVQGNYGFLFHFLDQFFGTSFEAKAGAATKSVR